MTRSRKPRQKRARPNFDVAVAALVVLDVDLADPEAVPHGQHRDVAVQLAVHLERVGELAAHRLEPAVEVAPVDAGDRARSTPL